MPSYHVSYKGVKFEIRVKCVGCDRLVGKKDGDDQEIAVSANDVTGLTPEMLARTGGSICSPCLPKPGRVNIYSKVANSN
jgi:hypothetical protein